MSHKRPKLIDRVRKHYHDARGSIDIPEWGVTLYFTPISQNDIAAVRERNPANAADTNAILLVMKAKYEDGSPAFEMGDLHFLKGETDADILTRLYLFMNTVGNSVQASSQEDAEGKSEPAAGSDTESGSAES